MSNRGAMSYVMRDVVLAPRSFAKPSPVHTAEPAEVGMPAPALPGLAPAPTVVAFLRHVGCPFAEATMKRMGTLAQAHPEIDFVAVTHSPLELAQTWCDSFGGAGPQRIVPDPAREHYAAWGVGISDRQHFAGKASMAAVKELLDEGIHNRRASGSRWQAAATFAVDPAGTIRWRHLPSHAGDLPALGEAVAVLTGPATG